MSIQFIPQKRYKISITLSIFVLLFCSYPFHLAAQDDEALPHHKILVRMFEQNQPKSTQQFDTLPPIFVRESGTLATHFKETPQGRLYYKAEKMPYFGECANTTDEHAKLNCSEENVLRYAQQNLHYPQEAIDRGVQGVVIVAFVVEPDGRIAGETLLRDLGYGCGEEAVRMIKAMPAWVAGKEGDKPVRVSLNLPIAFSFPSGAAVDYKVSWGSIQTNEVKHIDLLFNMNEAIFVRDRYGNEMPITELTFTYQRSKKVMTEKSSGAINERMRRLIRKKIKPKSDILLELTIQKNGQDVRFEKRIAVKKN